MGPVPVSPRKTPEKKGVPWARDAGMPEEGSATALKGRRQDGGTGHWAQDQGQERIEGRETTPCYSGRCGAGSSQGTAGVSQLW